MKIIKKEQRQRFQHRNGSGRAIIFFLSALFILFATSPLISLPVTVPDSKPEMVIEGSVGSAAAYGIERFV
ncbi:MAG: hypothetical protein L6425_12260, partial [Candidatus Aminicenantes bacterium]|nr:hypothetical protein [Candidatus Aminicenantes bacterium]